MGRYVNRSLMPGERVVHAAKVHWIVYLGTIFFAISGLILLKIEPVLAIPDFMLTALLALRAFITRWSTELVITDRRLIAKFGFIRRNTFEKHIERLEGINLDQPLVGRLLNYGTIIVGGVGGSSVPIPFIGKPHEFRNQLYEAIEKASGKPNSAAA